MAVVILGVLGLLLRLLTGAEAVDLIKTVVAAYIGATLVAEAVKAFAARRQ